MKSGRTNLGPFSVKDQAGETHIVIAECFTYATGEFVQFYRGGRVVARFNRYQQFRELPRESVPSSFLK